MKRLLFTLCVLFAAYSASAQSTEHKTQIDGGAGKYGILDGSLLPVGTTIFRLPPVGGTMLVSTSPFPSQAGHAGEYLTTDGTNLQWTSSIAASKAGIGSWYKNNVGAGSALSNVDVAGAPQCLSIVPPFSGNVSGISVVMNNTCTGGTLTATVYINNTLVPGGTVTITNGQITNFTPITAGAGTNFNGGDLITVKYTTTAGYNGPSDNMLVTVFATF